MINETPETRCLSGFPGFLLPFDNRSIWALILCRRWFAGILPVAIRLPQLHPLKTVLLICCQQDRFLCSDLPQYAWGFIFAGINTLISAYLYSTKRSTYAIVLNVARSLVLNTAIILGLPVLLGGSVVWLTFGISESIVLVLAFFLLRTSERNGIVYK